MDFRQPAAAAAPDMAAAGRHLIEVGSAIGSPKTNPEYHGRAYAVVPEGFKLELLETAYRPVHPKATVKLRDAASFVLYVNDHKVPATRIYAQLDPARFLAVFDEMLTAEQAGDDGDGDSTTDQANWREFRAEFAVPASREWLLWNAANRQHMSQLKFAEFLQDNLPDVQDPDGATLLEMALNFEAVQSGNFVATQRLQDGSHNLQWKADNNASGTVKLPEHLTLCIPVFENEAPREVQARLRYRLKEGTLAIWFELVRPHKVLEDAFRETWARIGDATGVPMLLGSPE